MMMDNAMYEVSKPSLLRLDTAWILLQQKGNKQLEERGVEQFKRLNFHFVSLASLCGKERRCRAVLCSTAVAGQRKKKILPPHRCWDRGKERKRGYAGGISM